MNVDTKLREAGEAIRNARRGEFTVRPPGPPRRRFTGPALAVAAAVVVVGALGVPAFLTGSDPSEPADTAANRNVPAAAQESEQVAPSIEVANDDFPYLGLELPDTEVSAAYDIVDETTGERVGTHSEYHQTWTNDDGEELGRIIEFRVQHLETNYTRFQELVAMAENEDTVQAGAREVTVHVVPDEATDECCYDLGVLRWIEQPGIEVILIPWGLNEEEAIELLDGIHPLEADEWDDLTDSHAPVATTVTTNTDP